METNVTNTNVEAEKPVSALERRLDLSVAIADLDQAIEQRLKRLGKNMKMPGFRPGKVPAGVVKQAYGDQARHEALNEALEKAFNESAKAAQLRVAGYPGEGLFSRSALRALHRASGGTPRLINILAHKSLMSVFGEGRQMVKVRHVRAARNDTEGAHRVGWFW